MKHRVRLLASRVLLFAMLATFLSPSLGWQMIASHEQLEHAGTSLSVLHHEGDHDDHGDAHGSIGHLLTHMPIHLATSGLFVLTSGGESELLAPQFSLHSSIPEAPFRPPRPLFLV